MKKKTPLITILLAILGILALLVGGIMFLDWATSLPGQGSPEEISAKTTKLIFSVILVVGGLISIGIGSFAKAMLNE